MHLKNTRGFGMTEVIIGAAMGAVAALALNAAFSFSTKSSNALRAMIEQGETLVSADRYVRRVGRIANSCVKSTVAGNLVLDCDVDKNSPPTGVLTKMRFTVANNQFVQQNFNPATNAFEDSIKYPGINGFNVCDKSDLQANRCTIPGNEGQIAKGSDRYFRYQLSVTGASPGITSKDLEIRSSFYVRNPTPFGANVKYQWGG